MMYSYEQAKEKALRANKNIDTALEYEGAYVFYNSKSDENDQEIVILKTNGNVVTMSDYLISSKDNKKPRQIKF